MTDRKKSLTSSTEPKILEFKDAKFNYNTDKLDRYFLTLYNEANPAKDMFQKAPVIKESVLTQAHTFDQMIKPLFKQQTSYQKSIIFYTSLFKAITADSTIMRQKIQEITGTKTSSQRTYLKHLSTADRIKRIDPDNGGLWEVIKDDG